MIAPLSTAGIVIANEEAGCGQPQLSVATGFVPLLEIYDDVTTADVPMQEIRDDPISCHPNAIILTAPLPRDDTALLSTGSRHFADRNDAPNSASPYKGDHLTKRGEKRKSPSRGLGSMVCIGCQCHCLQQSNQHAASHLCCHHSLGHYLKRVLQRMSHDH